MMSPLLYHPIIPPQTPKILFTFILHTTPFNHPSSHHIYTTPFNHLHTFLFIYIDTYINKQINRQIHTQIDRQIDKQIDPPSTYYHTLISLLHIHLYIDRQRLHHHTFTTYYHTLHFFTSYTLIYRQIAPPPSKLHHHTYTI